MTSVLEVASEVIHYSASQVETMERCWLRWWWDKIAGFKPPETENQKFGKQAHAELEAWAKDDVPPPHPRVAEIMRHFKGRGLVRGPALLSEREFVFNLPAPLAHRTMIGALDITWLANPLLPEFWDLKTTSDLRRYAKVDYQLQQAAQMNIYAYQLFRENPKANEIKAAHLYMQSKGAIRSDLVPVTFERHIVEKRWQKYLRVIDQAEEFRLEKDPTKIPFNQLACDDYGGCAHRIRCNSTIFSRPSLFAASAGLFKQMKEDDVLNPPDSTRRLEGAPPATPNTVAFDDLPEVLQKAAKKQLAAATPAKTGAIAMPFDPLAALAALGNKTPPSQNVEAKPETFSNALLAKLAGVPEKTGGGNPAPAVPPPPSAVPPARTAADDAALAEKVAEEYRTRDMQEQIAAAVTAALAAQAKAFPTTPAPVATLIDALTAPTKHKRGRPPKPAAVEEKPAEVVSDQINVRIVPQDEANPLQKGIAETLTAAVAKEQIEHIHVEPPAQKPTEALLQTAADHAELVETLTGSGYKVAEPAAHVAGTPHMFTSPLQEKPIVPAETADLGALNFLFIDCMPIFGFPQGTILLDKWLEPILAQIVLESGQSWQWQEFRKGPATLLRYVERAVLPRAMMVRGHSPERDLILGYLTGKANCIIGGTR